MVTRGEKTILEPAIRYLASYSHLSYESIPTTRHAIFYVHGHQVAFIETYFWQFSVSFLHRRYERYFWRAVFAPVTLNFKNIEISTCSYTMCGLCSTRSRIQRVAPKRLRDIRFEWFDTIFERFEKLTPMKVKNRHAIHQYFHSFHLRYSVSGTK
jgi:hypothetical protein